MKCEKHLSSSETFEFGRANAPGLRGGCWEMGLEDECGPVGDKAVLQ